MQHVQIPLLFSQEEFDEFARLSGDHNPIHVDPTFAAGTRFGRTVAHGMFLFSVMNAELGRIGGFRPVYQELMFRGPTFAGEPMTLDLHQTDGVFEERLFNGEGELVTSGLASMSRGIEFGEHGVPGSSIRGLEVGMTSSRERRFTQTDVDAFQALVNDRLQYDDEVPAGLLGGLISALLGVDLPGPGTNWLKQRFEFSTPVPVGGMVRATVTISRIRAEKELVNLSTVCGTNRGIAITGEALVLVRDVVG